MKIDKANEWLLDAVLKQSTKRESFSFVYDAYTFDNDPGVSEGSRNLRCVTLTDRYLDEHGPDDRLFDEALAWGERCSPPYPTRELRSTINARIKSWASKQHEGPRTPCVSFVSAPLALPHKLQAVKQFDPQLLPGQIQPWLKDIADRMQCPIDYLAISAMIGLASLLGRKISIRPKKRDDWTVIPNVFGAAIGRPGVLKSPAVQETLRPIYILEEQAARQYEEQLKKRVAENLVHEMQLKNAQQQIKKAIRDGKTEEARQIAKSVTKDGIDNPKRQRFILNDSSVEKLGEILRDNPNGTLIYRDELTGLLMSLDKPGQEGARAFFLEAWNGNNRFTYDRIGRGTIEIEAAIISILGSIQPGPLHQYLTLAAATGQRDDGLMQRFQLLVWPDVSKKWINVDRRPNTEARERAYEVYNRFADLDPMALGARLDAGESIPYVRFSEQAQITFDEWREKLERKIRSDDDSPSIEAHLAKYRSLVPTLALLIHVADGGKGDVHEESAIKAIAWADYLESHARRVYSVATDPGKSAAHILAKHILNGDLNDHFTLRDIYRPCWSGLASKQDADSAVGVLINCNWLGEGHMRTAGRTKLIFHIHPEILEQMKKPENPKEVTDKTDTSSAPASTEPKTDLLSVLSVPSTGIIQNNTQAWEF